MPKQRKCSAAEHGRGRTHPPRFKGNAAVVAGNRAGRSRHPKRVFLAEAGFTQQQLPNIQARNHMLTGGHHGRRQLLCGLYPNLKAPWPSMGTCRLDHMTLIRLRLNLPLLLLADLFCTSMTTFSEVTKTWIAYMHQTFLVFWPSQSVVRENMPYAFRK